MDNNKTTATVAASLACTRGELDAVRMMESRVDAEQTELQAAYREGYARGLELISRM